MTHGIREMSLSPFKNHQFCQSFRRM